MISISSVPVIPEFYAGKSVLITGGTGFLGKVLVNRLLATCPDIGRVLLLIRPKKDVTPEKRLEDLTQNVIYDEIRRTAPSQLDKLLLISGDLTASQLGLSSHDLELLQEVSIVFHSAATVRFEEPLAKATEVNVRPVIKLLDICDGLPNMEAFVYVSTAYSNCYRESINEVTYPAPVKPEHLLSLVDSMPKELLGSITKKYIHPWPNTYSFTKAVAECAVETHNNGNRRYSLAIFRPTIVVAALKYPYPGWTDNVNGPGGLFLSYGTGVLHTLPFNLEVTPDFVPVDITVDTLIAVAWEIAIDKITEVKVYNCSGMENPVNFKMMFEVCDKFLLEHPFKTVLWYPSGVAVDTMKKKKVLEFLMQTVPMHLAAYCFRLMGVKTPIDFIATNRRLINMTDQLFKFCTNNFIFETSNVRRLRSRLSEADARIFNLDIRSVIWVPHIQNFVLGIQKYVLKDNGKDLEKARRHMRRMRMLHYAVVYINLLLFLRIILRNVAIKKAVKSTRNALRLLPYGN